MATKDDTKQDNNPIPLDEPVARIADDTTTIEAIVRWITGGGHQRIEDARYSKEEVLKMRANKDARMYKTPDDVNHRMSVRRVWENGKVGYFIPFAHRNGAMDFFPPQAGGGMKDGEGLRFVQLHKDNDPLFADLNQGNIIVSGFGAYVLENWGKDLSGLCKRYTFDELKRRFKQWEMDNYPQKRDKRVLLQLLNELKEDEQNRWEKASISDFFTEDDNKRLTQCMEGYFKWINQLEDANKEKPESTGLDDDRQVEAGFNSIQPPDRTEQPKVKTKDVKAGKPQQYKLDSQIGNNVDTGKPQQYTFDTAKITAVYDFCINTDVLDSSVISPVDFINAVDTANFATIHNHAERRKRKSKLKYIIFILNKFVTGDDWYLNAAHSINTEPVRCSGITVPLDWKRQANGMK
jgi:hypothetical protein